ncbi:MAG: ABC transporter permease [Marmoricola sp.]
MSSTTRTTDPAPTAPRAAGRGMPEPIPTGRLLQVELVKMFDTRAGAWLVRSVVITSVLATVAVILFAPDSALTYGTFAAAIGVPVGILLPMIAVLSVTSEWSQRTGLTTFTLVPHRGRVIGAKLACTIGVGVVSILVAFAVGAIGNLVGASINGVPAAWDTSAGELGRILLANVLNMLVGFMLGVLLRNSPVAIVGYFVYGFALVPVLEILAQLQQWFADIRPWVDYHYAQGALYDGGLGASGWAHLAVSALIWLVIPTLIGLRLVVRTEVK